jgi:hypothetical protein
MAGEVEIATTADERITGAPGLLVEFDPGERHAVRAVSDARLLLPDPVAASRRARVRILARMSRGRKAWGEVDAEEI